MTLERIPGHAETTPIARRRQRPEIPLGERFLALERRATTEGAIKLVKLGQQPTSPGTELPVTRVFQPNKSVVEMLRRAMRLSIRKS